MNFNKTSVATVVSVALATTAFGAVASTTDNISPIYHNGASINATSKTIAANKQQAKLNTPTKSGMANQFDANTGTLTFQWAENNEAKPDMGAISPEHQLSYAADFYLNRIVGLSTKKSNTVKAVLSNTHDLGRGAKIAKYKQEVAGIEIFNKEFNIMMDAEFNLVASSGYLTSKKATTSAINQLKNIDTAFNDTAGAIKNAFAAMGGDTNNIQLASNGKFGKYEQFNVISSSDKLSIIGQPRTKKVFFDIKGQLTPAYYVEISTGSMDSVESESFSFVINANSGDVLFKNDLKSHASDFNYRVYADASGKPWDSPHGNVIPAAANSDVDAYLTAEYLAAPIVNLSHSTISTQDAWLADDAMGTSGNNAHAYVDVIAPDGFTNGDYHAETTSANTFDYAYNVDEAEYSMNNRKAAIVNLFFLNNYLHDDFYDHGFDEASGNAQNNNYGRGGYEGDALNVEVQDSSGFNNANMYTPADGYSPRMQMYLWDKATAANGVDWGVTTTSGSALGLLTSTRISSFGATIFSEFSGKLVIIDDGTDITNDGCEAAVNGAALAGNIAVIDRGTCAFTQKVKNAQDAGAIAVIIANNKDGDVAFTMGGTDATVTIPNVMISQNEGTALYADMANGDVIVSMFSNKTTRSFKASSWDNGIVAHEWGHYISNRLVGNSSGLINNQGRSLGEGWGDFHALLMLSDATDAGIVGNEMFQTAYSATSYVASFSTGIRRVPYSTDMAINPLTFAYIGLSAEVHDSGEIWASMLWDAYVALINDERHSFSEAQSLMKDYLVASYKMTPIAPTYTEARDAVLAAAYATDVADYQLILQAFADRGMGFGAVSPARYSTDHSGVVESYETKLATLGVSQYSINENYEGTSSGFCSNDNILDKGETGTVSFTVSNQGSEILSGLTGQIVVTSGQDVTLANNGMVTFGDIGLFSSSTSSNVEVTLNEAGTADNLTFTLTFPDLAPEIQASEFSFSTQVNMDFSTKTLVGTSQYNSLNTPAALHADFSESTVSGNDASGTFSQQDWTSTDSFIYGQNQSFISDVALKTEVINVGYDGDFTIDWWHFYNIEANWDGAVVEVSINGGDWQDITEVGGVFDGDGYIDTMYDFTEAAIAGRNAFTGFNYGYEKVNFGEILNGNQVQFRFRMATDSAVSADGWYIDDITFSNIENSIFSDVVPGDSFACDNRLPYVSVSADQTVNENTSVNLSVEASDPNGDVLSYSWVQTAGSGVTLSGANTANVSFTAPLTTPSGDLLTFEVSIFDGTDTVMKSVNVTVNDVLQPEQTNTSSGGSTGLLALLLLPLAIFRRRK